MPEPIQNPSNPNPESNPPPPANDKSSAQTKIAAEMEKLFPSGVVPEGRTSIKLAKELAPEDVARAEAEAAKAKADAEAAEKAKQAAQLSPEDKAKAEAEAKAKAEADEAAVKKAAADAAPPPDDKKQEGLTKEQLDAAEAKMDVKAGTAFKHVRGELHTEKEARIKDKQEFEARLKEAEAKASTVNEAEVTALREKVTRYEGELAITHVESTEKFQTEITQPLIEAEKQLLALATKYEIPESKLQAALSNSDPNKRSDDLSELTNNFNRLDTARFDSLALELEKLGGKRQLALAEAHKKLQEYQQQQEIELKQKAEQFKKSWTAALDTSKQILEKELPVFRKTGDEKWDAKLEEALNKVKAIDIGKVSDEDLAKAFYKASAFPLVLSLIGDLFGENSQLSEELTKYRSASLGAGAGDPPPSGDNAKPKPPTTMTEALTTGLRGILPP